MNFWVIDAEPVGTGALLYILWENGRLEEKKVNLEYKGYILPNSNIDPELLAGDLEDSGLVTKAWLEDWKLPPHYRVETSIIVFTVESLRDYRRVAAITKQKNAGRIVNDYPDPLVEALWSSGYHPFHKLSLKRGKPVMVDDPGRLNYENPPLKIAYIEYKGVSNDEYKVLLPGKPMERMHGEFLAELLYDKDIHAVASPLDTRLRLQESHPWINSINTLWVETDAMLTGFNGLIEWARLSKIPLREAAQSSIGKILTTIEAFEARRRRYLAMKDFGRLEPFRGITSLAEYDRGGSIYSPRPGLYWGVVQIDYNSLYPSIISHYNISGETVDDPECSEVLKPPGSNHMVCVERRGIVPSVMDFLIPRKDRYKKLMEEIRDPLQKRIIEERRSAVKWILVASFGYLGYRNSLFGSIMAHESVTSVSRSVMMQSREMVRRMGYKVIHALVDSLFIHAGKNASTGKCEEFVEKVSMETGFRARCDAVYRWLVIPRTEEGSGAGNKYYGLLSNGEFKVKGLLIVRRDSPNLVRELQKDLLEHLRGLRDPGELKDLCVELKSIYNSHTDKVKSRSLSSSELVIRRRIGSPDWGFNRKILLSLETGRSQAPEYIVVRRGVPIDPIHFNGTLDTRFYLRLLRRGFSEIASELCG